jgi:site-specific recombinase XerC
LFTVKEFSILAQEEAIPMTESTELVVSSGAQLPADRNPALVYLASLMSDESRRTQQNALNRASYVLLRVDPQAIDSERRRWTFLEVDWTKMRAQHVKALRSELMKGYAPKTIGITLSAVRRVVEEAWDLDLISTSDYMKVQKVKGVKGDRLPRGRASTSGENTALMQVCMADLSDAGVRDAAMIAAMANGGLRRQELVDLDLSSLDTDVWTLRVIGKNNEERMVPVLNGLRDALADWLHVRGDKPGPLFLSGGRGGHIRHVEGRLTTTAVFTMLRRRCQQAGVRDLSPHDLRRFAGTELITQTGDVLMAQRLLGHKSSTATERYDTRGDQELRQSCEVLTIPYRRRYDD